MNKAQKLLAFLESYYDSRGYKAWMDPKGKITKFSVKDVHANHLPKGYDIDEDAMEDGWTRLYVGPNEIDIETAILGSRMEKAVHDYIVRAEPTPRQTVNWDKFNPGYSGAATSNVYGPEFWGKHFGSKSRVAAFR